MLLPARCSVLWHSWRVLSPGSPCCGDDVHRGARGVDVFVSDYMLEEISAEDVIERTQKSLRCCHCEVHARTEAKGCLRGGNSKNLSAQHPKNHSFKKRRAQKAPELNAKLCRPTPKKRKRKFSKRMYAQINFQSRETPRFDRTPHSRPVSPCL
jgi:hypothetical protein